MKKTFAAFFFLFVVQIFCQQKISGRILSENDLIVTSVLVVNVINGKKVYNNSSGYFSIEASENDEIRFIKPGYERVSKQISDIESLINIVLIKIPQEIEQVEIISVTGDLSKDSKKLTKIDKVEQLQKNIGLPKAPEKPREVPAEVKNILIGVAFGVLDVQGIYDVVSGKARRQKRWYKYEDLQSDIVWLRKRIDDEYFVKEGISAERISEFLEFSFTEKPEIRAYIKAKNLSKVMFKLEDTLPVFVERFKSNISSDQ